jgi:hypothetical protein
VSIATRSFGAQSAGACRGIRRSTTASRGVVVERRIDRKRDAKKLRTNAKSHRNPQSAKIEGRFRTPRGKYTASPALSCGVGRTREVREHALGRADDNLSAATTQDGASSAGQSPRRQVQVRALSVRQPYADRIMRGSKRVEYRSSPTKIRGRVYVYASLRPASPAGELLLRGVLIGTVEVYNCTGGPGAYRWHLRHARRLSRPRKPQLHPQPVWFNPFP